jgi:hypothetical protein
LTVHESVAKDKPENYQGTVGKYLRSIATAMAFKFSSQIDIRRDPNGIDPVIPLLIIKTWHPK